MLRRRAYGLILKRSHALSSGLWFCLNYSHIRAYESTLEAWISMASMCLVFIQDNDETNSTNPLDRGWYRTCSFKHPVICFWSRLRAKMHSIMSPNFTGDGIPQILLSSSLRSKFDMRLSEVNTIWTTNKFSIIRPMTVHNDLGSLLNLGLDTKPIPNRYRKYFFDFHTCITRTPELCYPQYSCVQDPGRGYPGLPNFQKCNQTAWTISSKNLSNIH